MTEPLTQHVPDLLLLSAYLDEELDRDARQQLADHLAGCPECAAQLAALQALSHDFAKLPQESLGFDLAAVIAGRLAAAPRPQHKRRTTPWWGLLPVSLGAATSLAIGIGMGSALIGGGAVMPRMAVLSVFDALPPGGLCLGPQSCYSKGARK